MPVGGQDARPHAGEGLHVLFGACEGLLRVQVVHVADMGGQPGPALLGEAEGVLEVAAGGEGRRHRVGQGERQRGVTA